MSVKTTGLDDFERKMRQLQRLPVVSAAVTATASTGTRYIPWEGGERVESRDAVKNVIIMRAQAKGGRDVTVLSASALEKGTDVWRDAVNVAVQNLERGTSVLRAAAERVAGLAVREIKSHMESGTGAHGPLKPVKQATVRRKAIELKVPMGRVPPPLVRTGQLKDSLRGIARVRHGR